MMQLGSFIHVDFSRLLPSSEKTTNDLQCKYRITNFKWQVAGELCGRLKSTWLTTAGLSYTGGGRRKKRLKKHSRKLICRLTFTGGSSIKFTFSHLNSLPIFSLCFALDFYCQFLFRCRVGMAKSLVPTRRWKRAENRFVSFEQPRSFFRFYF